MTDPRDVDDTPPIDVVHSARGDGVRPMEVGGYEANPCCMSLDIAGVRVTKYLGADIGNDVVMPEFCAFVDKVNCPWAPSLIEGEGLGEPYVRFGEPVVMEGAGGSYPLYSFDRDALVASSARGVDDYRLGYAAAFEASRRAMLDDNTAGLGVAREVLGEPFLTEWRFDDVDGQTWHACVEERSDGWWTACCYPQEEYDMWLKTTVGISRGYDVYPSRALAVEGAHRLAGLVATGEIGIDGTHDDVAEFDPTRTDPHRPVDLPVGTGDRPVAEVRDMMLGHAQSPEYKQPRDEGDTREER